MRDSARMREARSPLKTTTVWLPHRIRVGLLVNTALGISLHALKMLAVHQLLARTPACLQACCYRCRPGRESPLQERKQSLQAALAAAADHSVDELATEPVPQCKKPDDRTVTCALHL